jgi:hypothetical protein
MGVGGRGKHRFPLRRLTLVTLGVTAADVLGLAGLVLGAGVLVPLADLVTVAGASLASYLLHRGATFGEDPFVRWVRQPAAFAVIAVVAGALDVAVVSFAAGPGRCASR